MRCLCRHPADRDLTRAEMCAFLVRPPGSPIPQPASQPAALCLDCFFGYAVWRETGAGMGGGGWNVFDTILLGGFTCEKDNNY